MTASPALEAGRRLAESLMLDMVEIVRPSGSVDPITGEPVMIPAYAGRAKVQTYEAFERTSEVGGGTVTVQRYRVDVPVGSYRPLVGDIVTISAAALDPYLADRQHVVRALLHKSMATAYRLLVDDNNGWGRADG